MISEEGGTNLENVQLEDLGSCRKLIVGAQKTSIIEGFGAIDAVKKRVEDVRTLIANTENTVDIDFYRKRISGLKEKAAVISIGASHYPQPELPSKKGFYLEEDLLL